MSVRSKLRAGSWLLIVSLGAVAALALSAPVTSKATARPSFRLVASQSDQGRLPPDLQAEIAANDAAGLPGLDRGVTVPAGCDIRTSLDPSHGRPRIEQERTVHRELNQGNTPAFITAANAQLQAYLQVSVRDYCASEGTSTSGSGTSDSGTSDSNGPGSNGPGSNGATGLPADLQAEIAANDAAGLPGLDRGVTVPAGCDIRTSLDPSHGRPRIEQERTVHRELNQGNTPAFITAANAQLQAYLQVSVRDYCASSG